MDDLSTEEHTLYMYIVNELHVHALPICLHVYMYMYMHDS